MIKTKLTNRRNQLLTVIAVALPLFAQLARAEAGPRDFYFPSTGVRVEDQALLLAIDDQLLPLRENMVEYLSKPAVRAEPVLAPSKDDPLAPDQVAVHFYGAVLNDNGRFRMWYYSVGMSEPGDARRADLKKITQGRHPGPGLLCGERRRHPLDQARARPARVQGQPAQQQTPSLPGTDPHSDRPRCGGRERKFLAARLPEHGDLVKMEALFLYDVLRSIRGTPSSNQVLERMWFST